MQTIKNANPDVKPKNESNYCQTSQPNQMIMTCHVRHIFMPLNQMIKK